MINNTETIIKDDGGGGTTTTPTGNNGNGGTSNTVTERYGDGGVSDCNDCNDCNNDVNGSTPAPDPSTEKYECKLCHNMFEKSEMEGDSGMCKTCYANSYIVVPDDDDKPPIPPYPPTDENDTSTGNGGTTFFCTKCKHTCDCGMMSDDPTLCKNCYAALHTPPDEEDEENTDTEVTEPILVSNILFDRTALAVDEGTNFIIHATALPENATDTSLEWSSSDNEVATVTSEGFVAARKAGEAIITATAKDGSGVSETCRVTVRSIPVKKVTVEPKSVTLAMGEKAYLYAEVCPCDASNQTVNWYSDCESIASVDDGVVIAHSDGVATITAISEDGRKRDTCIVTVDSREKVYVKRATNDCYEILFSDGRVWRCVNEDIVNDEMNVDAVVRERFYENTYQTKYYDDERERYFYENIKEYSDEELKLIYTIDPHGLAAYVKVYAANESSISETMQEKVSKELNYKDYVFRLLFNRNPRYYERDLSGTWYQTSDKDNSLSVVSESEFLFGGHAIYDEVTFVEFLDLALEIVAIALACPPLKIFNSLAKGLEAVQKFYSLSRSITDAVLNEDFLGYIDGVISGKIDDMVENAVTEEVEEAEKIPGYKIYTYHLLWIKDVISICGDILSLGETFNSKPHFYKEIFTQCQNDPNYNIILVTDDEKYVSITDINSIIE